jgi:alpha-beta hydrolase superfamily lysophospholipase
LGHSYGSFIAQKYIQIYGSEIEKAVLVGSAARLDFLAKMGALIAGVQKTLCGGKKNAKLIHKMTFSDFDKAYKSEELKSAWLTRDRAIVESYNNDPNVIKCMSINFQHSFLKNLKKLAKKSNVDLIRKDLPIFIISGEDDPVGGKKASFVKKLYEIYKENDLNATMKIYENARHEILNETNRQEVYEDVANFLEG